jgi:recombination protein RecR
MAMKLLDLSSDEIDAFANSMIDMKRKIQSCSRCNMLTDKDICDICSDSSREDSLLCVVEQSRDLFAIERGGGYRGRYFVLGGKLSPLNGVGPEDLAFDMLIRLLESSDITEIILATGSDVEGEATSVYAHRLLRRSDRKISRIAYGVPVGSSLDFADEMTLMRAIEGRHEYTT